MSGTEDIFVTAEISDGIDCLYSPLDTLNTSQSSDVSSDLDSYAIFNGHEEFKMDVGS
jgi:hypothetical protein